MTASAVWIRIGAKLMRHSDELKAHLVEQMLQPGAPGPDQLARSSGVSKTTLWRWRKEALNTMPKTSKTKTSPRHTPADKLRFVLASEGLEGQELGAFLRREGLHLSDLESWRAQMLEGLIDSPRLARETQQQLRQSQKQTKALQQELRRKDAALAEAAALLVLSKKVQRLWGDEDAATALKNDDKSSS